jgi:immunity protein 7 of polymorphic toxin system
MLRDARARTASSPAGQARAFLVIVVPAYRPGPRPSRQPTHLAHDDHRLTIIRVATARSTATPDARRSTSVAPWDALEMFEWHGWASIVASAGVDDDGAAELAQDRVVADIRALVDGRQGVADEVVDLRSANGFQHLWLSGSHNRDTTHPVDLFRAVARAAPGSYGVLHTHEHGVDRDWQRWVMRRGTVSSEVEQSLSPHVGAVEDPE